MDLKNIRIERLKQFARKHGAENDPSALGELIGKKPNQVYNLLHGMSSFGEKVARSIEAKAGLQPYWLDQENADVVKPSELLPDVAGLAAELNALTPPYREQALEVVRQAINFARMSIERERRLREAEEKRLTQIEQTTSKRRRTA